MRQPRGRQRGGRSLWDAARRAIGTAAVTAIVGVLVVAAPAAAQTLTEAFAYAYNNNPQLLAQRASLRATDETVPQALAAWRPTVNFTGSAGFNRSGFETPGVNTTTSTQCSGLPVGATCDRTPTRFSSINPRSMSIQAIQPLYRGGRTEAQTRQAINTVQSGRAQLLATETLVFQAVAQSFLDVVRDQTLVEVARNNEQVLKKQLQATQDRFRVGEVTRTDVAQAESSLAQATAQRITAEGNLEGSRANYARVVGHPPGRLVMPRQRPTLPATREEALTLAAGNNFNVISASFTELAARDNVDLVRGELLPEVSIVGTLSRSFSSSVQQQNTRTDSAAVIATMTMRLYEGGSIYSRTRAAEQTVGQRRSQVDDARRIAVQDATRAWETLQAARSSIASFGAAVRAAQIALEGTQQEALVGSRTVLDVLIAEQQLFTTQSQLVGAQHDAALAEYTLTAAIGRLIAPALQLPVKLYDMERHYKAVKDKWLGFGGGLKE
jgi:TolC family type I secretion outer membrane protein